MIVQLRKIETTSDSDPTVSHMPAEPPMIADPLNLPSQPPLVKNRQLRNWLIVSNIALWIAIIAAVRLILS
jgi:hypothetical protein